MKHACIKFMCGLVALPGTANLYFLIDVMISGLLFHIVSDQVKDI